jgi:hypothetical protein
MWLPEERSPLIGVRRSSSEAAPAGAEVVEIRGVVFANTGAIDLHTLRKLVRVFGAVGVDLGKRPLGLWVIKPDWDPAPLVEKCVVAMETLGDARLMAHVYAGTEGLVVGLDVSASVAGVRQLYAERGLADPVDTFARARLRVGLPAANLEVLDAPDLGAQLREHGLVERGLIRRMCSVGGLVLVELYERLGFEAGRALSLLHRAGFSWGTYVEHNQCHM